MHPASWLIYNREFEDSERDRGTEYPCQIIVHNHFLCLEDVEGEVVVLGPHGQVYDLLPIGGLVIVGDQAYHCCVTGKLNGVGVVQS